MFRKTSLLQAASIFATLTVGLAEASNTLPAASSWDEALNTLTGYAFDPLPIGPAGKILPIVYIVVGGLMFFCDEDPSKRVFAAILFAVGLVIEAANHLVWLFPR